MYGMLLLNKGLLIFWGTIVGFFLFYFVFVFFLCWKFGVGFLVKDF